MSSQKDRIIEVMSDEEPPVSVSMTQIQPGVPRESASHAAKSANSAAVSVRSTASSLPRSRILAGKVFAFRGTWLTMTPEAAEELCKVNGGEVSLAITVRTQYVVVGGKGTTQNTNKFTEHGATLITEAEFLGMILAQSNANKENTSLALSTSHKRACEESASGPSKPPKARKSDAGPVEEDMKWLDAFLRGRDEVRLTGKTLVAYDCGGEVFKAQRGKNAVDLLRKFNQFLADCQGEYH